MYSGEAYVEGLVDMLGATSVVYVENSGTYSNESSYPMAKDITSASIGGTDGFCIFGYV